MTGDISQYVKHVVILIQENRSFDEYFGTFPNASNFSDSPSPFNNQCVTPGYGTGVVKPYRLSTFTSTGEEDLPTPHDWNAMHNDYAGGNMNGWWTVNQNDSTAPSATSSNQNQPTASPTSVFGYYAADDIPYHWALAQTFALCDHYFCSVLGATLSNRLYLMSGAIEDATPGPTPTGPPYSPHGPVIYNYGPEWGNSPLGLLWPTYADRLTNDNVGWKLYDEASVNPAWLTGIPSGAGQDLNVLSEFTSWSNYMNGSVADNTASTGATTYDDHIVIQGPVPPPHEIGDGWWELPQGQFETDCATGKLPAVTWLVPPFGASEWENNHPAAGAYYIALKLQAILSGKDADGNPLWDSTVFIIVYDESGGHFDHVPPSITPANAPPPEQLVGGLPIGAGFRVPAIIISPWTVNAGVQSDLFDHTSILQFLERVTGVTCSNLGAWRRQTFGDLTSVFNFASLVPAITVANMLPNPNTVLGWKRNAEARFQSTSLVSLAQPQPPSLSPFPPTPQSCAASDGVISGGQAISARGLNGTAATIPNALTVTVFGFEADEFVNPHASSNPVSGVPLRVGSNQLARSVTTRVPTISIAGGGDPNELSFSCSQVSPDPNQLAANDQANNAQGVPRTITFWFAVTFNDVFQSFFFPFESPRYLDLQVSFEVDTTVTASAQLVLIGGTVGQPGPGGGSGEPTPQPPYKGWYGTP